MSEIPVDPGLSIPPDLMIKQPVEQVFELLHFEKNDYGCFVKKWGNLKVSAGRWLDCWMVNGFYFTGREIGLPEIRVPYEVVPAALLAALYRTWRSANPGACPTEDMRWGEEYIRYERYLQSLIPPKPTIWADREFLRFCLSYVERMNDWSESDYELCLVHSRGQLAIKANTTEVCCPARGQWERSAVVSARILFRRMPKRFMSTTVCLQADEDKIRIDSYHVKARWELPNANSTALALTAAIDTVGA